MEEYNNYDKEVILAVRKASHKNGLFCTFAKAIEIYDNARKTLKSHIFIAWRKQIIKDSQSQLYLKGN